MDKKNESIFDTLTKSVGTAISKAGQFARECKEQGDFLAAQRAENMRQAQITMQKDFLHPEHEAFANAVKRCLENEHQNCGLQSPRRIEDIMCDDENNNIRLNGTAGPDFSFEVNREFSIGLHGIVNGTSRGISAADIEKVLNRTLGKYATRRGYMFSRISVDDIPHGKVRITAHDVTLTRGEKLRRNGYPNYGY